VSSEWDPVNGEFGAVPFVVGTLLTSFLAIAFSVPFSLAIALFLGEYFRESGAPDVWTRARIAHQKKVSYLIDLGVFFVLLVLFGASWPLALLGAEIVGWSIRLIGFSAILRSTIELMAGVPSVIFGFWGLYFLVPLVREFQMWLNEVLEPIGVSVLPYGVGVFATSIILAIMIIPYSASVAREVISMVPTSLKEAAYSLGSTRLEVIGRVVLPYARSGIFVGVLLSLGRALGETMAVTMVIGNMNAIPTDIFSPGNTMASIIANEFTEATGEVYLSALLEIGLLLFVVSTIINIVGKLVLNRLSHH
jgi:phosphate transport system permease protein